MHRLPSTHIGQARRRTLLTPNPSAHPNQPTHRGQSVNHAMLDNGAYPICIPCVCRVSAKAFHIQDGPFLRDQPLQQVDTIIAQLHGQNHSVKTKHHPPEHPAKPDTIRVIKSVMDNRILGQAIDQSEARTEDSPTTNRQRQIVATSLQLRLRPAAEQHRPRTG